MFCFIIQAAHPGLTIDEFDIPKWKLKAMKNKPTPPPPEPPAPKPREREALTVSQSFTTLGITWLHQQTIVHL